MSNRRNQTLPLTDLDRLLQKALETKEDQKPEINLPHNLCKCWVFSPETSQTQTIEREKDLDFLIKVFHRKFKRNIILHGEKGIGKTSMAYALAKEVTAGSYEVFQGYPVIYFDLSEIADDELQTKMPRLISFMEENPKRVYILDGFYTLVKYRKNICSKHFKQNPYFLMGIMSSDHYHDLQKNELLDEFFEFIELAEPSIEDTRRFVSQVAKTIKDEYQVEFDDKLIDSTIKLAGDFLIAERFPQKAIQLLRLACNDVYYEKRLDLSKFKFIFVKKIIRKVF